MKSEIKERVAFVAASMIDLTNMMDMPEGGLPYVTDLAGVEVIRKLLRLEQLHYESSYEDMAEEICILIDWDQTFVSPWRMDKELSQMGHQIADLVEDVSPAYDDAAGSLFAVLTWCGIGVWLAMNKA